MRVLTDRGTEYCGNRESHEYQLYLAVENIDHSRTRAKIAANQRDLDIGTKDLIHACCLAHARRGFIDALKVQTKVQAADPHLERIVALMDDLFAVDRKAREQNLSLTERHALRQELAPALLSELHTLLSAMQSSGAILPQSVAGKAINYTLKRWMELTQFLKHPVIELSTNWAENSMRPIAIGRRNWLHVGSKEAGPKIATLLHRRELPQAGRPHSPVPGRRPTRFGRSLHPGAGRPHPSSLRCKSGKVD